MDKVVDNLETPLYIEGYPLQENSPVVDTEVKLSWNILTAVLSYTCTFLYSRHWVGNHHLGK